MKTIWYIARNELRGLFYSPIAWIILAVFLILTSMDYLEAIELWTASFERSGIASSNLTDIMLVHWKYGFLLKLVSNTYIFLPLITMGLISRELASGTIKLLHSSPVTVKKMVMGKFLAMVIFSALLCCLLVLVLAGLSHSLANPDITRMAVSTLAIFILLCTYSAIGLYISSLTSYQIVAAIGTIAAFAFLAKIGDLTQQTPALQKIGGFLSLTDKAGSLLGGLYNSRDVIYFLVILVVFLLFTYYRLQSAVKPISKSKNTLRYVGLIVAALAIIAITHRPSLNVYHDFTRDQIYTLTPPTIESLNKLEGDKLYVTTYVNVMDDQAVRMLAPKDQVNVNRNLWDRYLRYKPDIHIRYVYYYDCDSTHLLLKAYPDKTVEEIADIQAVTLNLEMEDIVPPEKIREMVDVRAEEYKSFYELSFNGKKTNVRNFASFDEFHVYYFPSEYNVVAGINRLVGSSPKIVFLTDELERGPFSQSSVDYRLFLGDVASPAARNSLLNLGYDFDTLSLKGRDIPRDIVGLVIADPRQAFEPAALEKIHQYIAEGGNLLIATEPDKRDVVQPLLDTLGVSLRKGLLLQPGENFSSDHLYSYHTPFAKDLHPLQKPKYLYFKYLFNDTLLGVETVGASALDIEPKNGFSAEPLLVTNPANTWNRVSPVDPDSLRLKIKKLPGDEQEVFTTMVLLTRNINNKKQNIIISGDADLFTSAYTAFSEPMRYNRYIGTYSISLFSEGEFPPNTFRNDTDRQVAIKVEDIKWQRMFYYYILPGILIIAGSVLLIRRRRK